MQLELFGRRTVNTRCYLDAKRQAKRSAHSHTCVTWTMKGNRKRATASCSSQYCHRTTTIDELASSSRLWRQRRRAWAASFCQTLLLLSLHWLTIKILLANILSIPVHDDDNNNNRNLFTTSSGRQFANSDELHFYSLLFCLVLRLFTIFDHSLPHYDYCRHYARNTREYIILLLVASHCEWACRCFYACMRCQFRIWWTRQFHSVSIQSFRLLPLWSKYSRRLSGEQHWNYAFAVFFSPYIEWAIELFILFIIIIIASNLVIMAMFAGIGLAFYRKPIYFIFLVYFVSALCFEDLLWIFICAFQSSILTNLIPNLNEIYD